MSHLELLTDDSQRQEEQPSEQQVVVGLVQEQDSHKQLPGSLPRVLVGSLAVLVGDGDLPEQRGSQRGPGAHQPAARIRRQRALRVLVMQRPAAALEHGGQQTVGHGETDQVRFEASEAQPRHNAWRQAAESRKQPETRKTPEGAERHEASRRVKQRNVDGN